MNQPPTFATTLISPLVVTKTSTNTPLNYNLPDVSDPESDAITMTMTASNGATFITLIDSPTDPKLHIPDLSAAAVVPG